MLKKYKIILAVSFSVLFIGISVFFLDYFFKLRQVNYQKAILYEDSFNQEDSKAIRIDDAKYEGGIISPGESISYMFDLKNSGSLDAGDINITVLIPQYFEFGSTDLGDFKIEGNDLKFVLEGLSPGQAFSFSVELRLKGPIDNNTEIGHPSLLIRYTKENEKIFKEAVLEKEISLEEVLVVKSSPDFNDSYIKIVSEGDDGSFTRTQEIGEDSTIYMDIFLKNTGDMDAEEVKVVLEGIYGLASINDAESLNIPDDIKRTEDAFSWIIAEVAAGEQYFYRFSFEADQQAGLSVISPYIKISSPSIGPGQPPDETDILHEPSFEGSGINVSNINGGKIYAGQLLQASVVVSNSSSNLAENINIVIELPDELSAYESPLFWKIDTIEAGQSVYLNMLIKAASDIDSDRNVKCALRVSSIFLSQDAVFESDQIILTYAEPFKGGTIPIIALHGIEPEAAGKYEISTEAFDYILRLLKTNGYETISLKDLYDFKSNNKALPKKPVIITSDDGYESIYRHAYPMLLKYGYRMSLFLSTGYIAESQEKRMANEFDFKYDEIPRRNMLIWPEIIEMANNGIEIGSHGIYHMEYGNLSFEEVNQSLVLSKKDIEENIKADCLFFAWPHDSVHPEALAVLKDIGYLGALRYKGGPEDTDMIDFYSIKRINIESPIPLEAYGELFMIPQ